MSYPYGTRTQARKLRANILHMLGGARDDLPDPSELDIVVVDLGELFALATGGEETVVLVAITSKGSDEGVDGRG